MSHSHDDLVKALLSFDWTDDKTVASFERYVAARYMDGKVEIDSEIGWISFPVPGDYGGENNWWWSQIRRMNPELKERVQQVALGGIRGDDFDTFLKEVSEA
jgi:hypothetical protein